MIYPWQFFVFLGYGIPLFLLYIFVLIQLIFNKEFKAPFFKIATILGFVDVLSFINSWFMIKLPLCPLTGFLYIKYEVSNFLLIVNFLAYYLPKIRNCLVLASSFNRLTVLALPFKHNQFWPKWLWLIMCLSFILPFLLTFQNLFGEVFIIQFSEKSNDSYAVAVETTWYPLSNALLTAILYCIASILTFGCNLLTLYRLYIRKKTWKNQATINSFHVALNKGEINLLFVSFWDFILDLIMTIHQTIMFTFVIRNFFNDPLFDSLYLFTPWIMDAMSLSRPIILIAMCKQMRVALIVAFAKSKRLCENQINNSAALPSISLT